MKCLNCGSSFVRDIHHGNTFFKKYCSKKCGRQYYYKKHKEEERKKNKQWYQKNKESELIKNKEYRKLNKELFSWYHNKNRFSGLRMDILNADGNKCVFCDSTKKISVHHIDGKNHLNSSEWNNKYENLITLCNSCHHRLHHYQRKIKKVAYDRAAVIVFLEERLKNLS